MNLQDQVCTLEQALKLREMGVEQVSLFYWINRGGQSRVVFEKNIEFIEKLPIISAYTSTELGLLLPAEYYTMRTVGNTYANFKYDHTQSVGQTDIYQHDLNGNTEAQARAKMLINILEAKMKACPLFPGPTKTTPTHAA